MGLTFVVAGSGPSLTAAQARSIGIARRRRDDLRVIAVNDAVYPLWFADIAYACDGQWWIWHGGLKGFAGWKLRLDTRITHGRDINEVPFTDIDTVVSTDAHGYEERPGFVRSGGNSASQATHVAAHLGAEKIILVGLDMRRTTPSHFFGEHPVKIRRHPRMEDFASSFTELAGILQRRGVEIVNATPQSALKSIRSVDLDVELQTGERQWQ